MESPSGTATILWEEKITKHFFLFLDTVLLHLIRQNNKVYKMFESDLTIVILTGRVHMSMAPCNNNLTKKCQQQKQQQQQQSYFKSSVML